MSTTSTRITFSVAEQDQLMAGLEEQRRFRIEQIDYLSGLAADDTRDANSSTSAVDREVRAILLDGAHLALARIVAAGDRLATGRYGRCVACEATLPADELSAVPEVSACADCRRGTSAVIG